MANNDQISEAYNGNILSEQFQRNTRDRIHWICSQARGEKILDIGCSQGIVPILLGREGFKVTGIDLEEEAIRYANKALELEETSTANNVKFIHGNIFNMDFGKRAFDTVILAEVIEHLTQPERVYELIAGWLERTGLVIITTPFGINDHPDHKKTYYPSRLIKEIHPYFELGQFKIIGKWICLTAKKRTGLPPENGPSIDLAIAEESETYFQLIERTLMDKIKSLKESLERRGS